MHDSPALRTTMQENRMRLDTVQQARAMQGRYECSGRSNAASPWQARQASFRTETPHIQLDGSNGLLVALLLLGNLRISLAETMQRPTSPFRPDACPPAGTPHFNAALIPGAGASGYQPVDQPASTPATAALSSIANSVVGLCTASPRRCATAVGMGTLMVGTVAFRLAVDQAWNRQPPATSALQPAQKDRLLDAIDGIALPQDTTSNSPLDLQDALLDIARHCGGDRQCRARKINALLRKLPGSSLSTIQRMVDATAAGASSTFPPGADAFPIDEVALRTLASLLADIYTPDVAAYQDDMESIVAAGREAGDDADAASNNRLDAIKGLLERDGHHVEERGFQAADRVYPDVMHEGINLLVTPTRARAANASARRLLLVAHGDVAGTAAGSEGAYDNASGVAAVLHVLRQLHPHDAAGDTQIQALITTHEERGLLGSSAFVEQCTQRDDCPTLVVNIDMIGRGGHNYMLSGSDLLAGHYYAGKPPMNLNAPAHSAVEESAADRLQALFSAQGFSRQPPGPPPLLTSDNLSFQNASIPTLGLAQMSGADAIALRDIQQARARYEQANTAVDWSPYVDHHEGRIVLTHEQLAQYREAVAAADQAWDNYLALRKKASTSSSQIIHTVADQLHRVNPRMAMDFNDALAGFVRDWAAGPTAGEFADHSHA